MAHLISDAGPGAAGAGVGVQKPLCSICYEDLKPIIEDLQSISLCGHVFHELCLQQWLEYCPSGKKPTCPVCKQSCSQESLTRLYFQSSGDATQLLPSDGIDAEALAEQVKRLEGKLSSMTSNFQSQQMHLQELNKELSKWKEFVKLEEARNEEVRSENKCLDRLVRQKNEELSRKSSECLKLEERNLMLAKELAALKLVTDLNLGEGEMVKLASIGHGANHANVIDVLKSSLALRNKSYKELMAQCNALGRAEARTQQKLDKAKEKIKTLKVRLQELERAVEEKENVTLRKLKTFTLLKTERVNTDCVMQNSSSVDNRPLQDQTENCVRNRELNSSNYLNHLSRHTENTSLQKDFTSLTYKECKDTVDIDDDELLPKKLDTLISSRNKNSSAARLSYHQNLKKHAHGADVPRDDVDQERASLLDDGKASSHLPISLAREYSISSSFRQRDEWDTTRIALDRNVKDVTNSTKDVEAVLADAVHKHQLSANKDLQAHESAACPRQDFTRRNVSKWGRLAEHKSSASASIGTQAQVNKRSLITVGADGRGGKIKVLRAHDQYLGVKEQKLASKRCKLGANQSGQFQIEHFFEKN
ncbi:TRAF-interacting protein [Dioscorea alata]|uniref:TRAF-interacting protein n=1 Tax=Dioscorea alata TaxID=55571 RepID=A0ACB7WVF1_DIOAL|nr:TRAF-interacting protein [Dioscorea alata]